MDASLAQAVECRSDTSRLMRTVPGVTLKGNEAHITVFIEMTTVPASLKEYGVDVLTRSDGIYVARLPVANLEEVASLPGVVRLEADAWVEPFLDLSVPDINADDVWQEEEFGNLQGEGVIVGMVDSGISLTHQDFLEPDASGLSRIRWIWDQGDPTGPAPQENCWNYTRDPPAPASCGGTECSPRNEACSEEDDLDHGTLVMGAMAGNGQGNCLPDGGPCIGVARKGEIIVVKLGEFQASKLIQGVDYIFQKAAAAGKPAVVNLSWGWYTGSRDGNSLLERSLSNLTGPGRIIVASAGNEALAMGHAFMETNPQRRTIFIDCAPIPGDKVNVYGWYDPPGSGTIEVRVLNYDESVFTPWVPFDEDAPAVTTNTRYGLISIQHGERSGDARGFTIILASSGSVLRYGQWHIEVRNTGAAPLGATVDLWVDRSSNFLVGPSSGSCPNWARFIGAHQERKTTITPPCTADDVICVSSYNTRCIQDFCTGCSVDYPLNCVEGGEDTGDISSFSSLGPPRDGGEKPLLAAPGNAILTPDNRGVATYSYTGGTSFAAPHVGGTVALMLGKNPRLTPADVRNALKESARPPDGVLVWDAAWGWGKVDAYGAVAQVPSKAPPLKPQGLEGGDDFCFIATAAFGDTDAPQVKVLRELRDKFFLRTSLGSQFVRSYYRWSPPVAAWLKEHTICSRVVRVSLLPAVGWSEMVYHRNPTGRAILFGFGLSLISAVCYFSIRRRTR
jgi:subtilisin family serine protease